MRFYLFKTTKISCRTRKAARKRRSTSFIHLLSYLLIHSLLREESSGARLWEELILKVVAPGDVARLVSDVRRQMEVLKSTLTQIEDTVLTRLRTHSLTLLLTYLLTYLLGL